MINKELEPVSMEEEELKLECYAMYKYELAALYRVDVQTLVAWMDLIMDDLVKLGYHKNMKKLTPKIVRFIIRHLGEP